MSYTSHLDIPYPGASSPRQALDLYLPTTSSAPSVNGDDGPPPPLLVFIHGGAWRSENKSDFRSDLVPLMLEHPQLPLAVIEYRLAPTDPHPAQITDVLSALNLLSDPNLLPCEEEANAPRWNRERLILLGHSAGAFMCLQILLDPPSHATSPRVPTPLRNKIEQVFLVDGIYDLPSLLDEYPSYLSFVSDAFGTSSASYEVESPARWSVPTSVLERRPRFHILHSKADDLLSLRQPDLLHERLSQAAFANAGPHSAGPPTVQVDYDTLQGAHYDVVHSKVDSLARYVARAVLPPNSSTTP
ncbi:hypothetical protein JCM8115_005671 [Rhodotorula mucilaginosa]|nr:hypothetical protein B0A53_04101 [Rhodotorula sp. CCFEE 5036]